MWDRFGAHVRQLVHESRPATGERTVVWDVTGETGDALDSGYYLVRATADDFADSAMIVVSE